MYQSRNQPLAPAGSFRDIVRRAAQAAERAPTLTGGDRQLLWDLAREESRYQFSTLDRLVSALAQLPDRDAAIAFADDLRDLIVARLDQRTGELYPAFQTVALEETDAECAADPLQQRVAFTDDAPLSLIEAALLATRRHVESGRRMMRALSAMRFAKLHRGRA
jgi:hypothetical protein